MSGAAGSNACPAGSARIVTEAACRTAAPAVGRTFAFVVTLSDSPRGCYYWTSNNKAYFNDHEDGAGHWGAQLLCSVTTGAPIA